MDARVLCPGCVRGVQQRFHLLALLAEDHGHLFADRAIRRCHQSARDRTGGCKQYKLLVSYRFLRCGHYVLFLIAGSLLTTQIERTTDQDDRDCCRPRIKRDLRLSDRAAVGAKWLPLMQGRRVCEIWSDADRLPCKQSMRTEGG